MRLCGTFCRALTWADEALAKALSLASAWCSEQGADSLEELKEVEAEADFVAALQLKPLKAKLLLSRMGKA